MARSKFSIGVRYRLKGEWFIIRDILVDRKLLVESLSFGGRTPVSVDELVDAWAANDLTFEVAGPNTEQSEDHPFATKYTIKDFDILPKEQREETWRKYEVILPLLELPPHERTRSKIDEYVNQLRKKLGLAETKPRSKDDRLEIRLGKPRGTALSRTSVETWLNDFIDSGYDIRSLVDRIDKCGAPGEKRLNEETEKIIKQILDECEKVKRHRTNETVHLMVVNEMAIENRTRPDDLKLTLPGKSTIYRRIHERGAINILRRRRSRSEMQAEEPVQAGPLVTRIMQRGEFDDTPLHLIVVDDKDRLPIGRPTLGFGLDKYSQFPLGFYTGFEPASYKTTMSCMLHCILPKGNVKKLYGTEHDWLARGLVELALIDNGSGYLNRHLLDAFVRLGIPVEQCPMAHPWFKGSIERFFRTNNEGLIHPLPGSTLSDILMLGGYDPTKDACITLSAFKRLLHVFLLDVYAQTEHGGINATPAEKWLESERIGFAPTLLNNADELRILLYWNDKRTLQKIGVEFETLTYQSPDQARMRSLLKNKEEREVLIKVNPDDISYIFVLDPLTQRDWLRFDAKDPKGYTRGLSLWKHRIISEQVPKKPGDAYLYALAKAKEETRKIVEGEYKETKKTKSRKRANRFLTEPEPTDLPPQRVISGGVTLAPPLPEQPLDGDTPPETPSLVDGEKPVKGAQKKRSQATKKAKTQESVEPIQSVPSSSSLKEGSNDLDTTGWGSDYRLPQRT